MEAAVPVSYSFPSHDMAAVTHRRMMAPPPEHQSVAYYHNPYATQMPQQSSYGFSHILNNQHHATYQNFFQPNPPLAPPAPRITSEPSPVSAQQQPLHEVHRPAKHEISRLITETTPPAPQRPVEDEVRQTVPQEKTTPTTTSDAKPPVTVGTHVEFSTEIDTLMKAIQAKTRESSQEQQSQVPSQLPPLQKPFTNGPGGWMNPALYVSPQEERATQKQKRKYECTLPGCRKSFFQKTHLDIHMRSHTGDKPFTCKEPGCGQKFSQLGNLRTHERRHTGEKPFACEICHKRFAQRGNVRAHKITHQEYKPYKCELDDCGKQFTQLGNLKSHQNKFHASTLRRLTLRFANVTDIDRLPPQEQELWKYFASLYKNSNKGIKGRGKDRRVSTAPKSVTPPNNRGSRRTKPTTTPSQTSIQVTSPLAEQTGHLTPPASDDNATIDRGYDRIVPETASTTANTTPYLATPTSEEVSFHDQAYPPYSHHGHALPQLQHPQQHHHHHHHHHHHQQPPPLPHPHAYQPHPQGHHPAHRI